MSEDRDIAAEKSPLIVAYIGEDDPNRGDSKGSIGVARATARMLGGRFECVEADDLTSKFNCSSSYSTRLRAYAHQIETADIVIGHEAWLLSDKLKQKPLVQENRWNEDYSEKRAKSSGGMVAHDLSDELLAKAGAAFKEKTPNVKGRLVGVLMGGCINSIGLVAKRLSAMAKKHDAITFYLCPSRRTAHVHQRLKSALKELAQQGNVNMEVIGADYQQLTQEYNPYHGLLDQADHLVLIGESGSLISEALYTKKPLYMSDVPYSMQPLVDQGHILDLAQEANKAFLKKRMPRIDVTQEVAQSIAEEYLLELESIKRRANNAPTLSV